MEPAYIKLQQTGELAKRAAQAHELLRECRLCPRDCGVDRLEGELGFCKIGERAQVASVHPHFGEEAPLVGQYGSGTIFFTSCNLKCVFCQNYEISHLMEGREVSTKELASMMIQLQDMGCHNINYVTPSHVVPQILAGLVEAVDMGLRIPLVYNTGGYDSIFTLKLLDGVINIYMPDIKFNDSDASKRYCTAPDYPEISKTAVSEMHKQVGDLHTDEAGVAKCGLLVRHLVMPNDLAGTRGIMKFLAQEVSTNTYVNIMDQYRPCGEARKHPELMKRISGKDFDEVMRIAREEGLSRFDKVFSWR